MTAAKRTAKRERDKELWEQHRAATAAKAAAKRERYKELWEQHRAAKAAKIEQDKALAWG